jgi:hypothetical protein
VSTKLSQQYPNAMPALLARHNEILNQAIQLCSGFVFQIVGDSFSVALHSAGDALNGALLAQKLLYDIDRIVISQSHPDPMGGATARHENMDRTQSDPCTGEDTRRKDHNQNYKNIACQRHQGKQRARRHRGLFYLERRFQFSRKIF